MLDTPPVCTALLVCLSGLPDHARQILEERLEFWVTIDAIVLVVGIVAAVYLF